MYYRKLACVLYLTHSQELAVEWYSSYLDEILVVSEPSLQVGSASPAPLPPLPLSLLHCSIDIQSPWQMFQSPGIKNEAAVIDRLHCEDTIFKVALHSVNGEQLQ